MAKKCMRRMIDQRWRPEGIQGENIKVLDGRMAKYAHAWLVPKKDQRLVQQ